MALIKHANSASIARDAVVLDLGDLRRQGEEIVARARSRGTEIESRAREERERILAGANEAGHTEGFGVGRAEGHAEGFADGRSEAIAEFKTRLEVLETAWTRALLDFERRREDLVQSAERDVIRLAATIAERVIKRSIELDPGVVVDQMQAALATLVRPTRVVISVSPADHELAGHALPGLVAEFPGVTHAELVQDPALDPGSCVVRTRGEGGTESGGEVDASIAVQIDRIVSALLPEPSRGTLSS